MHGETYKLDEWAVCVTIGDGYNYQAPELQPIRLSGIPSLGHPRGNGGRIRTSSIENINGKFITTRSGTVYELGTPQPAYLEWLKQNNLKYDSENPIKQR